MKLPTFTQKAGALTWLAGANMNGLKKVFANNILTCIKSCEFHLKESCNMNGLKKVFANDMLTCIKSCEFHLKESCNRMAKKTSMMEDDGEGFKGLCDEMLVSSLKETYLNTKAKLEHFIQEKAETLFCTMP